MAKNGERVARTNIVNPVEPRRAGLSVSALADFSFIHGSAHAYNKKLKIGRFRCKCA